MSGAPPASFRRASTKDSIRQVELQAAAATGGKASESAWPSIYVAATSDEDLEHLKAMLKTKGNKNPPVKGDTLLAVAARFGNAAGVEAIIAAGYDVNEVAARLGGKKETALFTAALWGHPHVVKLLLEKGANVGKDEALEIAQTHQHSRGGGGSDEDYDQCVAMLK